jgi:hypothetical protein
MNAKEARELIDQVCAELDAARDCPGQAAGFLKRVIRPAGLGLLMGLGSAGALAGCGEAGDLYGIPQSDGCCTQDIVPGADAYAVLDMPPAGDLYGVPDTMLDGVPVIDGMPDLYGVIDAPPAGDLYGVPDAGVPDSGNKNG